MPKKANPRKGEFRTFVERVNSDHLVRLRFLVDPIHEVDEAGIHLSEQAKSELRTLVHAYVESFPNIALLSTGLSSKSRGRAVSMADSDREDDEVFII